MDERRRGIRKGNKIATSQEHERLSDAARSAVVKLLEECARSGSIRDDRALYVSGYGDTEAKAKSGEVYQQREDDTRYTFAGPYTARWRFGRAFLLVRGCLERGIDPGSPPYSRVRLARLLAQWESTRRPLEGRDARGLCLCGCGDTPSPKLQFAPGHAMRFAEVAARLKAGEITRDDIDSAYVSVLERMHLIDREPVPTRSTRAISRP